MDVTVPDLGDFSDVEVIDVLVKPGDVVAVEDSLITLETDKAAMDVPSPAAGKVSEVKVSQGSTVSAGDLIVVLETDAAPGANEKADSAADDSAGQASAEAPDEAEAEAEAEADADAGADTDADADGDANTNDGAAARTKAAADGAGGGGSGEPQTVTVPELGDFTDVDVIEVLVAVGDLVEAEQGLITLETDKATMDVPTPVAGRVLELMAETGGTINPGDPVARIEPAARSAAPEQKRSEKKPAEDKPAAGKDAKAARAEPAAQSRGATAAPAPESAALAESQITALPAVGIVDEASFSRAHASPSVRKLARELGVDLGRVKGTGHKGRVTADDVKTFVKRIMTKGAPGAGLPKVPEVDFARFGDVETVKLSRIQKISGPRLQASWVNLPHVTQHDDADITDLEEKRRALKGDAEAEGIKLTPLAFVMRACVLTLEEFPQFRSSLNADGSALIVKNYYHLGFAADTPNGLVVPVIRDADRKDLFELAAALGEQSAKARDGKLSPNDMQGGVFTISSLGGIGGSYFTPIINAPEVAILGVSRSRMLPVYNGSEFVPRLMLPLSLSYDHRVIDGAQAARFITHLSKTLGQIDRLVAAIP